MKGVLGTSYVDNPKAPFVPSFFDYLISIIIRIINTQVKPEGLEQSVVIIFSSFQI